MRHTRLAAYPAPFILIDYISISNSTVVNIDSTLYGYNSTRSAMIENAYSLKNYDPMPPQPKGLRLVSLC